MDTRDSSLDVKQREHVFGDSTPSNTKYWIVTIYLHATNMPSWHSNFTLKNL